MRWALAAVAFLSSCGTLQTPEDTGDNGVVDAGAADTSAPLPPAASCKDLLAKAPSTRGKSGVYDGIGSPPRKMFCDMALDGGGWTLVARSGGLTGATSVFGWRQSTGDVSVTDRPYSVDVTSVPLTFDTVLVANTDRSIAYAFAVTTTFVSDNLNSAFTTGNVQTLAGGCSAPPSGPSMFKYAGHTSLTDHFFFRDLTNTDAPNGLHPTGFDLASYKDCPRGGYLDGQQGVVMVR